jgi:sperm-associated antigen 4 protein
MNRRERLRVARTPDTTLNLDSDDSSAQEELVMAARRRKVVSHAEKGMDGQEGFAGEMPKNASYIAYMRGQSSKRSISAFVRDHFGYLVMMLPYALLMYLVCRKGSPDMERLRSEVAELRNENMRMRRSVEALRIGQVEVDLARIEKGAKVLVGDVGRIFKYGFKGFERYRDPNIVLCENMEEGECLSFKGSSFSFTISLGRPAEVRKIGIFHPITRDVSSAIKEFEVIGRNGGEPCSLGVFRYDADVCGFQLFELQSTQTESVELAVNSNSGNRRYTCIYKVYVFGISDE